jgi:predicted CoA-binding protein
VSDGRSPVPLTNPYQDTETIRRVIGYARTVAIVGLSSNVLRASNFVGYYLKLHGLRVIPVNPREHEVYGEPAYRSLLEVPDPIDVVDVFRQPEAVPAVAREAVQVGAKALWLQFSVISPEGARIAADAGLDVVMDRCLKIEHARYLGQMHWLGLNTGRITSRRG